MDKHISGLMEKLAQAEQELEAALASELKNRQKDFQYRIEKKKVLFEENMKRVNRQIRQGIVAFLISTPITSLLVAPVIYSLYIPLALLDLWIMIYQAVCFKAYGIPRVRRSDFIVLDRGGLPYLNFIEQFNCNYCGYANGLVAYAREVASRTEQYFCPIKHARKILGTHDRYRYFFDFGDGERYRKELERLREELRKNPKTAHEK
ncbi:MAG: hypothetical protein M1509_06515 [Nitrospirae bacterium]|nr:hypothetical protein [Nitrospirota bacterium]